MSNADEAKEYADGYFKNEDYLKAIEQYLKAHDIIISNQLNLKRIEVTILSNTAMCFMKMNKYEDALEFCDKALKVDVDHVKSLFRKGKCLSYLYEFDNAVRFFKQT